LSLMLLACVISLALAIPCSVVAEEAPVPEGKLSIGVEEEVMLLPWGVKLPARVDTGAAMTSLDARHLVVKGKVAEFQLPERYGGLRLSMPVVGWKSVRSAEHRERRPVVELEICLGPKRLKIRANLNDRSLVKYPMILGRNVLREGFFVDCDCVNLLPPSCAQPVAK